MAEEEPVECRRIDTGIHHSRSNQHDHSADQMKDCQNPLGRKEPVGNHPHKKWRNDSRDWPHGIGPGKVVGPKADRPQVVRSCYIPCPPDKKLEKHHHRQLGGDCGRSGLCFCVHRFFFPRNSLGVMSYILRKALVKLVRDLKPDCFATSGSLTPSVIR